MSAVKVKGRLYLNGNLIEMTNADGNPLILSISVNKTV